MGCKITISAYLAFILRDFQKIVSWWPVLNFRMIRPNFILFFCLLATVLVAQPQSSTGVLARAEVDRTKPEIGDKIWLKVLISAPPGTQVEAIDFKVAMPDFGAENLDIRPRTTIAETPELLLEQRVNIQLFDTGYLFVPELAFPYRLADGTQDTAKTESLLITVSGIPVSEDDELMPIKPIIKEPLNWLDFWPAYLAAFVLLAGYLVFMWYRRQERSRVEPPPPPPKPAHVIALERLDDLENAQLWQKGDINPYYTRLSYVLRAYLEDRFNVPALESTTRQIDTALAQKSKLSHDQRTELSQLLQLSDLVKFARAEPEENLHQRGLDRVRTFVENTVPTGLPEPKNHETPIPPLQAEPAQPTIDVVNDEPQSSIIVVPAIGPIIATAAPQTEEE